MKFASEERTELREYEKTIENFQVLLGQFPTQNMFLLFSFYESSKFPFYTHRSYSENPITNLQSRYVMQHLTVSDNIVFYCFRQTIAVDFEKSTFYSNWGILHSSPTVQWYSSSVKIFWAGVMILITAYSKKK